jgi:hypothetical protein
MALSSFMVGGGIAEYVKMGWDAYEVMPTWTLIILMVAETGLALACLFLYRFIMAAGPLRIGISWVLVGACIGFLVGAYGQPRTLPRFGGGPIISAFVQTDQADAWATSVAVIAPTVEIEPDGTLKLWAAALDAQGRPLRVHWTITSGSSMEVASPPCVTDKWGFLDCPADGSLVEVSARAGAFQSGDFETALVVELTRSVAPHGLEVFDEIARRAQGSLKGGIRAEFSLDNAWERSSGRGSPRVERGTAASSISGLVFYASDQTGDPSEVAVSTTNTAAVTAFNMLRDLSLIILGGAVTLTLDLPKSATSMVVQRRSRRRRIPLTGHPSEPDPVPLEHRGGASRIRRRVQ